MPEIIGSLFGLQKEFMRSLELTASRINSRNSSVSWESERNVDFVHTFLKKKKEIDGVNDPELDRWLDLFAKDKWSASLDYWYDIHKGTHESLREFPA